MKKICLDLGECNGLGDLICATPTIEKLSKSYETRILVLSQKPELFKQNPFVEYSYKKSSVNYDYFRDNGYIIHNSFYNLGIRNEKGIEYKHNLIDIRQFHAINLGFMLLEDEMKCFYLPTSDCSLPIPSNKYFVIHPVRNWESRTWKEFYWQELTEILISKGFDVVAIGKDSNESGFFSVNKPTYQMHGSKMINYLNKTSISDCWHIIQNSEGLITMDSGLLHLAGTTSANIYQLGSSINPAFRKPYRNESGSYKYILGYCSKFCASDMKYGVKEWGNIQGVPPIVRCLENYPEYKCHPTPNQVIENVLNINNE